MIAFLARALLFAGLIAPMGAAAMWPPIAPFPRAVEVETADDRSLASRRLVLGALNKIKNVLEPEAARNVIGTLKSSTYLIPDESRVDGVRAYYSEQLKALGEVLFSCESRSCGSSNYWANTIFERAILYGPEQFQSYMIVRLPDVMQRERYVQVYVAQRGTRKVYAHVAMVEVPLAGLLGFAERLLRDGAVEFRDGTGQLQQIAEFLVRESDRRLAIVAHGESAGVDLETALRLSENRAERLRRRLIEAGADGSRLVARGVGPLAPAEGRSRDRIEVVLLPR